MYTPEMDLHPARDPKMKRCKNNKKRFTDEQIRSLETMFNSETRPESLTKQQIADQLGLMPRQVAIWFQNRRARCKSKQMEHEYGLLKASYEDLASQFKTLKTEHQHLISELQRLKGLESKGSLEFSSIIDPLVGGEEDKGRSVGCFEEEAEVLNMVQSMGGSPLSSGNCHSLESILEPEYLLEDNCDSEWWESY